MAIWKLKGCIRCGGDMFLDRDEYGWYEGCLRCGYRSELVIPSKHDRHPIEKRKKRQPALAGQNKR